MEKKTEHEPVGTVEKVKSLDTQFQRQKALFDQASESIQFLDLTKSDPTRTYNTYSKDKLRNYLKNPKTNESNLRNLSRFLYRMCHSYRRLIHYNAQQVDLTAMSVIPMVDITQDNDPESVLKSYYDTALYVQNMDLASEIYKCLVVAWMEGTCYGYVYEEDDGHCYIMILDGDYCKVSSTNYDSTLNFAFNFSYLRNRQELLEYWDSEFQQKYDAFTKDNSLQWQELDPEKTICLKIDAEDPTISLPVYASLFEHMIDLCDLQSIQSVKDQLSIYKLLVAKLKHIQGSSDPDDFEVDIQTAISYFNKLAESLPPYVAAVLSPVDIDTIEFKDNNTTNDVDMISNSMGNLFKMSGGSLVLNDEKDGTTIYEAQIIADSMNALKPLLGQIEAWVNRHLSYKLGDDHAKIKYHYVTPWTKKQAKADAIQSAQNGLPEKLYASALDGFSPLEALSLVYLENEVLSLHTKLIPFTTSYTQSGDAADPTTSTDPITGGAPEKDSGDLTDSGDATKQKEKNTN